jgi:hypothetical protein
MPKCKACSNDKNFLTTYIEFEVVTYSGDRIIDQYSGDRERLDEQYPPECNECGSTDIEGVELI